MTRSYYNPTQSKKEMCKEHNEELSYFCFDCLCRCICSECVVHGVHKNHDVMNIKRAYPLVVEKVNIYNTVGGSSIECSE